ncbi:MAG: amidohydrolase family protein [Pseudomonadota bacterium]
MRRALASIFLAFVALVFIPAYGQAPKEQLATPPANAQVFAIISTAGRHGTSWRWTTSDGVRWSRESILLRGFATEIDQQQTIGADGSLINFTVRGSTPSGDASESFSIANGRYQYQTPVDHGADAMPADAFYASYGGTIDANIAFLDALRAAPNHTLPLLPSGHAQMQPLTTQQVTNGHDTKTLTAYAVIGTGLSPFPVWYDGDHFFAVIGVLSYIPEGWESVASQLSRAQDGALATRSQQLVNQIAPHLTHPVIFEHVRLYDSINRRFLADQSVVVDNGRITAVGRASAVHAPANAQVISGAGKTLAPGLWDSHQHYGDDSSGPLLLAQGITSVRDPGNRPEELMARKHRIDAGDLLGPRIVPSLLIDGQGPNTAQVAVVVHNEQEAIVAVHRAKDNGYFGIKLYGTINPAWVTPMAAEAHRLGLHVHGHIPAGMRPLDAVRDGYDEITHINFVMMQAMPDDVVAHSNGLPRVYGTARYAPDVNLHSPEMTAYLDELQHRHIAVDPTLVTFESLYLPDPGDPGGAYAPFIGTMPLQVERGFKSGGLGPTPEVSRDQMRRGFTALSNLVEELHRRNMTIVAGTDGTGLELVRELELYVAAGFTPADALATATINPSRLFGVGNDAGSITVGKKAELFLVDGDPSQHIGDLRNVIVVMRDGRLMQASDLRSAIGISGPPHRVN